MTTDARTTNRDYPKPDADNLVSEEFPRLADALDAVDQDVAAVLTALDGKAPTSHTHTISSVTGLQAALDGKAPASHAHSLASLTDVSVGGVADGMWLRRVSGSWQAATIAAVDVSGLGTMATEAAASYVSKSTGAAALPTWSGDGSRPASPANGWIGYNTTRKRFEGYIDGAWSGVGASEVFKVDLGVTLATVPQTITIAGGYDPATVKIFRNGIMVESGFTASDGATVVVSTAVVGDRIRVLGWNGFTVANTYSSAAIDAALALKASTSALATVATSGAYSDLTGKPTLGTAAALDVGTTASKVVQLDGAAKLPAVDGSALTNLPIMATAAAAAWNAVGAYVVASGPNATARTVGTTYAGSGLTIYDSTSAGAPTNGQSLPGTWMYLGSWNTGYYGLFRRVS